MEGRRILAYVPWFVGYAFLWATRLVAAFDYPLFGLVVSGPTANNPLNMSMLVTYGTTLIVVGVLSARIKAVSDARPVYPAGILLASGMALGWLSAFAPEESRSALLAIGGVLGGLGDAGLSLAWDRYFAEGSLEGARRRMPVGLAVGAALYFVVVALPGALAALVLVALPLGAAFCLHRACKEEAKEGVARRPQADVPMPRSRGRAVILLAPVLLCAVICGIVFGLIGQIALTAPFSRGAEHLFTPMGAAGAGLIACVLAFAVRRKVTFDNVYVGVFAVVSLGLLLLPFAEPNYAVLLNAFVSPAHFLTTMYYLYYAVEVIQAERVPAYAVYGISRGILCFSTLLAVFLSVSVYVRSQFGTVQLMLIAFLSAYLFAMGLVLIMRKRIQNPAEGKGTSGREVPIEARATERSLEALVRGFAETHDFSKRESEVFALLAAGRTHTYIAQEINLAPSTVKGYIQSIYRKCSVHGRQELIDAFEAWRAAEPPL